jgi:hypothetical protein
MDLSEFGEAAVFLRRTDAERLPLPPMALDGENCHGYWQHFK